MLSSLAVWHVILLVALIGLPIAALVFLAVRARKTRTPGDPTPVVSLTLVLAALYAVTCVIGAVWALLSGLMSPTLTMTVPVREYWPLPLPGVTVTDGPTAEVVGGGFTTAELVLQDVSSTAHILWASGQTLGALVPAAIAGLIALACFQLLRGAAFAPVVARAAMITAVVVLVGGLGSQILSDAAGSMVSSEALTITAAEYSGYPDDFDLSSFLPQPSFGVTVDFWPIFASLGFAALAAVFRYGTRLQKDAELLV